METEMNINCTLTQKKLCLNLNCEICKPRRFSGHLHFHDLDPNYEGNKKYNMDLVMRGTDKIHLGFICKKCNHSFTSTPIAVTRLVKPQWCTYCPSNGPLCSNINCERCKKLSFESHPLSKRWNAQKNEKTPRDYKIGSKKKVFIDCEKCIHTYDVCLDNLTRKNAQCRYCAGREKCSTELNCKWCGNNSFLNNPNSKYWSKKNTKMPEECAPKGKYMAIFDCHLCNKEFSMKLYNVSRGSWCSCTVNRTESILYNWLILNYNEFKIERQKMFAWCKNQRQLVFDFCFEELKLIIELDGIQHFEQIANWTDPKITQERDKIKMKSASEKGYLIIRILQEDIYNNYYNWKEILQHHINNAIKFEKLLPKNHIFIGKKYPVEYISKITQCPINIIQFYKLIQYHYKPILFIPISVMFNMNIFEIIDQNDNNLSAHLDETILILEKGNKAIKLIEKFTN